MDIDDATNRRAASSAPQSVIIIEDSSGETVAMGRQYQIHTRLSYLGTSATVVMPVEATARAMTEEEETAAAIRAVEASEQNRAQVAAAPRDTRRPPIPVATVANSGA